MFRLVDHFQVPSSELEVSKWQTMLAGLLIRGYPKNLTDAGLEIMGEYLRLKQVMLKQFRFLPSLAL